MQPLLDFALRYGLFLAETITVVAGVLLVALFIGQGVAAARREKKQSLQIERVDDRLTRMGDLLADAMQTRAEAKARTKQRKVEAKHRAKHGEPAATRLFVLDFDGDIRASAVEPLRESINALLQVAREGDEVLLRLESGGGLVHSYGLAAAQLDRLKAAGLRLNVAVDRVAASGGYMMACVGDRIIAAPFAIIGSIGVVAQLPNFHRWLNAHDIDFEMHTAGHHKRTLTLFGENTESDREKFRDELEQTHGLFKSFVAERRPTLDIDTVATGEHWYGRQALERGLIDALATSDDLLLDAARDNRPIYAISQSGPTGLVARLSGKAARVMARARQDSGLVQARFSPSSRAR